MALLDHVNRLARRSVGATEPPRPASDRLSRRALLTLGATRLVPADFDRQVEEAEIEAAARRPGSEPGLEDLKEEARRTWGEGDYRDLGRRLEQASEELVEACGPLAGVRFLDVGAGDGNLAGAAARRGAEVTASDLTPALVEQGSRRLATLGLDAEWTVADVEALPFEDGEFDCAASCFGALYAPRPLHAASELFRVVRPGGIVAMANWSSTGFMGHVLDLEARWAGMPPGVPRPSRWGRFETVYLHFTNLAAHFEIADRTLRLELESPEAAWSLFSAAPGRLRAALPALDAEEREAARAELLALVEAHRADRLRTTVEADFLLVVGRRPG